MTHEDVLQACHEETDRVLSNGIEPANEHLAEFVKCEAIIDEILRLYTPITSCVRYYIGEHTVGTKCQLRIPFRTTVLINTYILYRRSDLWP
ncbi:unnamed protein product [Rotaria sordida]|uniref:Uncharacterized protein n=1 Tax=Rotaria sordida TaxID=392033 RepID=A0A818WQF6_9BILA|nr:unnamed protein product [Rotaria sordida]CAF1254987.1 unnamed protein product [Rotaria sordida]CAF3729268.1 unnamed protein product [Rotaria sordida]CAF3877517.1 unnamed protein product [Rotaria sordida]